MSKMKNKLKILSAIGLGLLVYQNAGAQNKALVNTAASKYAKLSSVDMGNVTWTQGFWADRFKVCRDTMIPNLWKHLYRPKDQSRV
jgi:hypothetical protein